MEFSNNNKISGEFFKRFVSAVIIFIPVLFCIYKGGFLYYLLLVTAVFIAGYEWSDICGKLSFGLDSMSFIGFIVLTITALYLDSFLLAILFMICGLYVVYYTTKIRMSAYEVIVPNYINRVVMMVSGFLYLAVAFAAMVIVRNEDAGLTALWGFLGTVFSDVFAYIFGSMIGGKKLAPKISPSKTWSGLVAACIATGILSYIFAIFLNSNELLLIVLGVFLAIFSHVGDIIESKIKRYLAIKDTSNIIPGHGGLLDRMDSLFMVAIYIALLIIFFGQSPLYIL